MKTPEVLEIAVSHYCEKARWALDYHGIEYIRRSHLPLVTRLAGRLDGVWHTVPVLFTEEGPVCESAAIVAWADAHGRGGSLLDSGGTGGNEVGRWVRLFDEKLGPATRRIAYFHVLGNAGLAYPMLQQGVSLVERALTRPLLPLLRRVIQKSLKIDASGVERSRKTLRDIWKQVDMCLADGRRYLVGERFSAADLTFAALAAPMVLPAEYGAKLPACEDLSDEAQEEIASLRKSAPGQFVLRVYRDHRNRVSQ